MSARKLFLGLVATVFSAGPALTASGQKWQPFAPVDYVQDFAPFETFDIKTMSDAPDPNEGFFFSYNRLSWAATGEKNVIGDPNVVAFFPDVLRGVNPPQVFNGLNDSAPEATFSLGNRYELGYIVDHHGWTASVLDGWTRGSFEEHGFLNNLFDNPNNQQTLAFGSNPAVGNVVILFNAPPNSLLGYLFADTDGDGNYDTPYDLDGDGTLDLDDLITYLPTFDLVQVRNYTRLYGVEVMKAFRFKPTSHGSVVEFSYGARYLKLHDNFRVDALGGPFNDLNLPADATNPVDARTSFWDTTIDNNIVGPQLGLRWSKRKGRFAYNASGRFTFGYNIQDHKQTGQIVTAYDFQTTAPPTVVDPNGITVAQYNGTARPALLGNSAFTNGKQKQDFSPVVEFRAELDYYITQQFALTLGFNATFIDNIRRASRQVDYTLPNMGFVDGGTQEILIGGVNFGCEFNR